MSLRICAVSPEPSFLSFTKHGSGGRLRLKIRSLVPQVMSAWAFKIGFCAYVIKRKSNVLAYLINVRDTLLNLGQLIGDDEGII